MQSRTYRTYPAQSRATRRFRFLTTIRTRFLTVWARFLRFNKNYQLTLRSYPLMKLNVIRTRYSKRMTSSHLDHHITHPSKTRSNNSTPHSNHLLVKTIRQCHTQSPRAIKRANKRQWGRLQSKISWILMNPWCNHPNTVPHRRAGKSEDLDRAGRAKRLRRMLHLISISIWSKNNHRNIITKLAHSAET